MFKIRMGIPEMKQIWENLEKKYTLYYNTIINKKLKLYI